MILAQGLGFSPTRRNMFSKPIISHNLCGLCPEIVLKVQHLSLSSQFIDYEWSFFFFCRAPLTLPMNDVFLTSSCNVTVSQTAEDWHYCNEIHAMRSWGLTYHKKKINWMKPKISPWCAKFYIMVKCILQKYQV